MLPSQQNYAPRHHPHGRAPMQPAQRQGTIPMRDRYSRSPSNHGMPQQQHSHEPMTRNDVRNFDSSFLQEGAHRTYSAQLNQSSGDPVNMDSFYQLTNLQQQHLAQAKGAAGNAKGGERGEAPPQITVAAQFMQNLPVDHIGDQDGDSQNQFLGLGFRPGVSVLPMDTLTSLMQTD